MKCFKCGVDNPDFSKFCCNCGSSLKSDVKEEKEINNQTTQNESNYSESESSNNKGYVLRCPNCGGAYASDDIICSHCGSKLKERPIITFTTKLEKLEEKRRQEEFSIRKAIAKLIDRTRLNQIDKEIFDFIATYPIPRDKEDIVEFAELAKTNSERYGEEDFFGKGDEAYYEHLSEAWETLFERVDKAHLKKFGYRYGESPIEQKENSRDSKKTLKILIPLAAALMLIFAGTGTAIGISEKVKENNYISLGYVKLGLSSTDLKKKNYQEVENIFLSKGFTNVQTFALGDLVTGWINKEFTVDSVSIDGVENFSSSDYFNPASYVAIKYHSYK